MAKATAKTTTKFGAFSLSSYCSVNINFKNLETVSSFFLCPSFLLNAIRQSWDSNRWPLASEVTALPQQLRFKFRETTLRLIEPDNRPPQSSYRVHVFWQSYHCVHNPTTRPLMHTTKPNPTQPRLNIEYGAMLTIFRRRVKPPGHPSAMCLEDTGTVVWGW